MKKIIEKKYKQCLSYKISVEGQNCEMMYFNHLQKLINNCETSEYKVNFDVKKKNPKSFAKSQIIAYPKKGKKDEGYIKFIHVQDIEDYHDEVQRNKFHGIIDEIQTAKKECKIDEYELGYTNYSFDLWMVIHKFDLKQPVEHRSKYYIYINKGYNKNYTNMNEYKSEKEFQSILNKITLVDVLTAIKRGKDIRNKHINDKDHLEIYNGFKYYRDNPDITLHLIIESILIDCKIISKR